MLLTEYKRPCVFKRKGKKRWLRLLLSTQSNSRNWPCPTRKSIANSRGSFRVTTHINRTVFTWELLIIRRSRKAKLSRRPFERLLESTSNGQTIFSHADQRTLSWSRLPWTRFAMPYIRDSGRSRRAFCAAPWVAEFHACS